MHTERAYWRARGIYTLRTVIEIEIITFEELPLFSARYRVSRGKKDSRCNFRIRLKRSSASLKFNNDLQALGKSR